MNESCPTGDWSVERPQVDQDQVIIERAVLALVLALHQLTIDELKREMNGHAEAGPDNDEVDDAAQHLARVGLLHCQGDMIAVTPAALHFDQLQL